MAVKPSSVSAIMQVVLAVTLVAVGQLCMRRSVVELGPVASLSGLDAALHAFFQHSHILLWAGAGVGAYLLATFAWLQVLSRHDLSFAFPLTSMSYVLVYVGAINWPILEEQAQPMRTLGIIVIMVGVALVVRSGRERP